MNNYPIKNPIIPLNATNAQFVDFFGQTSEKLYLAYFKI